MSSKLPRIMRPVSPRQLVADVGLNRKHAERGFQSLQTNRGNTLDYVIPDGVTPPPTLIVRDTGESVMGDGMAWIVEFQTPEILSGTYDSGLKVRIIYGEGGARETIILDASPGFSIAIPATSIDVQVFSSSNPPMVVGSVARCTALLYRGFPASSGNAKLAISVLAGTVLTEIPSFARSVGVLGNGDAASILSPIFSPTATLDIINGGLASVIRWPAATLLTMFNNQQRIQLPGNARQILTNTPGCFEAV